VLLPLTVPLDDGVDVTLPVLVTLDVRETEGEPEGDAVCVWLAVPVPLPVRLWLGVPETDGV
jgi:hypothetical protein